MTMAADQGPASGNVELVSEALVCRDILWWVSGIEGRLRSGKEEFALSVEHSLVDEDYTPSVGDFFGHAASVSGEKAGAHLLWRHEWSDVWRTDLKAGGYDGITDYVSLWRAEFYRQQYEDLPGYAGASPSGVDCRFSTQCALNPGELWLRLGVEARNDTVVSNYEIVDFGTLARGRELIRTASGDAMLEGRVLGALRVSGGIRCSAVTDRDLRHGLHGGFDWAFAPGWVLHADSEGSLESAGFRSWSVQGGAEREIRTHWLLGATGRIYRDNGAASLASGWEQSAPALRTLAAEGRLRYQGDQFSFLLAGGPYQSDFGTLDETFNLFAHLYRQRTWISVRAVLTFAF